MTFQPSVLFAALGITTVPGLLAAAPTVQVQQDSYWSGGYSGFFVIENPVDQPLIEGWSMSWQGGLEPQSLWNGLLTVDGDTRTVSNESWNGVIAAGGSCSIGFTADGVWPPSFPEYSFNGTPIDVTVGDGGSGGDSGGDSGGATGSLGFGELDADDVSIVIDMGTTRLEVLHDEDAELSVLTNAPNIIQVSLEEDEVVVATTGSGYASIRVDDAVSGESAWIGIAVRNQDGSMPGLPEHLAVGSVSEDAPSHLSFFRGFGEGDENRRTDIRYIYINGGPFMGWRTWTSEEGARVSRYIRNSKQLGMIPCLVWYNIPDGGESYWTDSEHLFDASYMEAYWRDLDLMLDLARAETEDGWPVMIVIEPDLLGYFAQAGLSPDQEEWSVGITGSPQVNTAYTATGFDGDPILTAADPAFGDSIDGLVEAINYLIDRDLPSAIFGWQFNLWASPAGGHTNIGIPGTGLVHVSDSMGIPAGRAAIVAEAEAMAQWYVDAGVMRRGADFISLDKYGLDAGGTTGSAADDPASSAWFWNNDHWLNYLSITEAVGRIGETSTVLWQIPVGHINTSEAVDADGDAFPVLDNTHQHWEDSAGTFFLGDSFSTTGARLTHFASNESEDPLVSSEGNRVSWGAHMQATADAGVVAVMFGAGVGTSTQGTPRSDTTDGEPTDGGWWVTLVQRYLSDPVLLPSEECLHDLTGDNAIDIMDLLALISAWGSCEGSSPCPGDFDADGSVDADDLLALLNAFGLCGRDG